MSWVEVKEQNEIHDKLVTEAREMVAAAAREGKPTLPAEEDAKFHAIMDDADKAAERADRLLKHEGRAKFEIPVENSKEARDRFFRYGEHRAMTTGNDALGGAFVDVETSDSFLQILRPASAIRQIATVFNTSDGSPFHYPKMDDTANSAALVAENAAVTVTDVATSRPVFAGYQIATAATLPWKLVRDVKVPAEQWVLPALAERYVHQEDLLGTTGTGSGQPQGYITGGTNSGVVATNSAITFANMMDLIGAMPSAYDIDGDLTLSGRRATKFHLFKLVDSSNRPIWQLGDFNGRLRPLINGIPFIENQHMAAIGTTAKSVALVSKKAVLLRQVGGVAFAVEVKPSSLQNIYVAYGEVDVKVVHSAACLYIQQAA